MPSKKTRWNAAHIPKTCVAIDGERTEWSFESVEGLVLDCTASGDRIWKVRYRVRIGGRRVERKSVLGRLDLEARRRTENDDAYLTPGQAKDRADDILGEVRRGGDPWLVAYNAKHAPQPRADITVAAVYSEWLDRPGRKRKLRNRSRESYEQQFRDHVAPYFGKLPINALQKPQIAIAIEKVRQATTKPAKGMRGYQATKALKLIRSICRYALTKEYIERDPTLGLKFPVPETNPDGRQNRPPSDAELRQLWLTASEHMSAQHVKIMKLAFLLGKRISEMCGALKSEVTVEGDRPSWYIPGTREGNKSREDQIVPLPPLAASILREQITAFGASPYLFPAKGRPQTPTMRHAPSQAFADLRTKLGIDDAVRFHDARGLISDQMAKIGVPSEYRSHVLHHTDDTRASLANSVYSTYDYEPQKRRALELWERRLLEIAEGRPPSGERW